MCHQIPSSSTLRPPPEARKAAAACNTSRVRSMAPSKQRYVSCWSSPSRTRASPFPLIALCSTVKTFQALADRYLNEHARRHKRSAEADERNLREHIIPERRQFAFAPPCLNRVLATGNLPSHGVCALAGLSEGNVRIVPDGRSRGLAGSGIAESKAPGPGIL